MGGKQLLIAKQSVSCALHITRLAVNNTECLLVLKYYEIESWGHFITQKIKAVNSNTRLSCINFLT